MKRMILGMLLALMLMSTEGCYVAIGGWGWGHDHDHSNYNHYARYHDHYGRYDH